MWALSTCLAEVGTYFHAKEVTVFIRVGFRLRFLEVGWQTFLLLCTSFSFSLQFVKPGPRHQGLPAAPSVAAKCPKSINEKNKGDAEQTSTRRATQMERNGQEGRKEGRGRRGSRNRLLKPF